MELKKAKLISGGKCRRNEDNNSIDNKVGNLSEQRFNHIWCKSISNQFYIADE